MSIEYTYVPTISDASGLNYQANENIIVRDYGYFIDNLHWQISKVGSNYLMQNFTDPRLTNMSDSALTTDSNGYGCYEYFGTVNYTREKSIGFPLKLERQQNQSDLNYFHSIQIKAIQTIDSSILLTVNDVDDNSLTLYKDNTTAVNITCYGNRTTDPGENTDSNANAQIEPGQTINTYSNYAWTSNTAYIHSPDGITTIGGNNGSRNSNLLSLDIDFVSQGDPEVNQRIYAFTISHCTYVATDHFLKKIPLSFD